MGCAHVGSDHAKKRALELANSLDLNDDLVRNYEIESVRAHFRVFVYHRDPKLALERNDSIFELDDQSTFVNRLEKARTKLSMNLNSRGQLSCLSAFRSRARFLPHA